ncbi:MAG: ATP-binding cassette domain-containing protein [Candidatus Norongarragalinales archaeon]
MKKADAIVELHSVIKDYAASAESEALRVLHGVTFSIARGEFVAVMGASGSGKSTLLHLIGCLDKPTSGSIVLDGIDVALLSSDELAEIRARKVGFVFQAFNLLPNFTALQNVELAMTIAEKERNERRACAARLLEQVGLGQRANHKPNELSGGEKQRVAIARALANEPALLLMDEPTGNLDSKAGVEVMKVVQKLWREKGLTVVVVTHERSVAEHAQRIIHLKDGVIINIEKTVTGKRWFKMVKKREANALKPKSMPLLQAGTWLAALAVFLMLAPFASAAFNVTAVQGSMQSDFRVTDVDQVPDRVFPGDEVVLKMSASTVREGGVFDAVFSVITPFDKITSTTTIDRLAVGEKKLVSRSFTVPVGTKPGTYFIYVYASAAAVPQQEVARIPLVVFEPSVTDLLLAQVAYNESVRTGESARILINLTNTGVLDAEDVFVQLALNASSPFTPLEYDRKYAEKIKAGESIQIPFLVGVKADASPGFYPLTVNIRYSVDKAVQPTIQQNLGLKVEANQQLLVTSDFGAGSAGAAAASGGILLTLTIANVGDTAVRGVYAKASSDYYRIIGASDKFIGTLNLDDSSTMTLTLSPRFTAGGQSARTNATSRAEVGGAAGAAGEPTVTVIVSYKDPLNQERTLKQVIPLRFESAAGAAVGAAQGAAATGQRFVRQQQQQGFLGVSWVVWASGAVALAAAIVFWWLKKREKKQRQLQLEEARRAKKSA